MTGNLASAFQECFNAATAVTEVGLNQMKQRLVKCIDVRCDNQDDTVRLIWLEVESRLTRHLPIDD